MSAYALWTEVAIWVLVAGAPLVFAWFLKDAVRLVRGLGRREGGKEPGPGEESGPGEE